MELLKKLYLIDAHSGQEKAQREFIMEYVKNIKDATFTTDKTGNLLVTKGKSETYPCVVAHMDEVHYKRDKDFVIVESNGFIMGMNVGKRERHGIGADDKNGIWVALKCLEKYDAIKCAFFVGEEVGCKGSNVVDLKFFEDCRFVVECDRRGKSDFITSISGELCSKDFVKDAKIKDFGYKQANGLTTDVNALKNRGLNISCCNMSCGYYDPHTEKEFTYFPDLEKCLGLVEHIIDNCVTVYKHERPKPKHVPSTFFGSGYYNEYDDDPWYPYNRVKQIESYEDRILNNISKKINLDDYDNMLDAWCDLVASNTIYNFSEFTKAWIKHQKNLADAELDALIEAEKEKKKLTPSV